MDKQTRELPVSDGRVDNVALLPGEVTVQRQDLFKLTDGPGEMQVTAQHRSDVQGGI